VGVAVNVTAVPAHTGLDEGAIETLTGKRGSTVIVMEFEVAGLLVMHSTIEEVKMQVTTSPLEGR
jgi:hypothetical protein